MNAPEAVLAANDAFYRAFESLDVDRMQAVWLQAAPITCIHPGGSALVGWAAVMESWEQIFGGTLAMRFTLTDLSVHVRDDLAWVLCVENIDTRDADGRASAHVQTTNLFQRRDGRWWLVHHHGAPLLVPRAAGRDEPPLH